RIRRSGENDREDREYWGGRASAASTIAIVSCILFFIPGLGFIVGLIAWFNASSLLGRLHDEGARAPAARDQLNQAKSTAVIGMIINGGLWLTCCIIRVAFWGALFSGPAPIRRR